MWCESTGKFEEDVVGPSTLQTKIVDEHVDKLRLEMRERQIHEIEKGLPQPKMELEHRRSSKQILAVAAVPRPW